MATTVAALRDGVRGEVIGPDDPPYDEARAVYNAMIDRRPAVVVRPVDAADAAAAVNHARENGLDLAIRGGGHSVPGFGTCEGGVVIDLSGMREIAVDPAAATVRAGGGCTWGDFNKATHEYGLATPRARGPVLGAPRRRRELRRRDSARVPAAPALRHLRRADVLRGGGRRGRPALLAGLHRGRPRGVRRVPRLQIAPPLPFIPEDLHGDVFLAFVACWAGPLEEGDRVLAPFHDVAPVVAEHVGPMPCPDLNGAFDALVPPGLQHYWKASLVTEFTDDIIRAHLEHGPKVPVVNSTVHIYPINGACHRVGSDETTFAYRDADLASVIAGMWPDPAQNETNIAWVRDYYAATAPHSEEGGYVNFMAGDDQDRMRANYRGNYDRPTEVKQTYDPGNLFHLNQNIAPAG